ncbi:restriction endonuclease [Lysobacter soyae]|uniref:Restriction endonuclease n=1 Tax=Lysobacter soyae TaxID=2764185 RepID=A0ABX8WKV9_9GAMM|nr:restriction endonuclease [Lysobacter sp. CJ11]QYR52245.1 restriction endonuclease [Lysobacter sp. CJ11]
MKYGLKRVKNRHQDLLTQIPWDRLESLLAVYYAVHGFKVEHSGTGKSGGRFDGGIDLKLRKDGEYILVQVKHWNAYKVPHNDVNQLMGLRWNEGATGAILITSGEFTHAAIEAAKRHGHVELIDGIKLREMIAPFVEFSDAAPVPAAQPISVPDALFKQAGGREEPIPLSVRMLIAVAGVVILLLVMRSVIGKLTDTFNAMGQQTIERAQESAARAKRNAENKVARSSSNGDFSPTPAPLQARPPATPQYQTWETTPASSVPNPSESAPKPETAADRNAREAFLKSVPEV